MSTTGWRRWLRTLPPAVPGLVLLTVVCTVLTSTQISELAWVPLAIFTVPLLLGSLLLSPRALPWFVVTVMALLVVAVSRQPAISDTGAASIAVYFLLGFLVMLLAFRRARLGVDSWQGEDMFVDLRDRILGQAGQPTLPAGWHVGSALASASGTLFAGDFVLTSRPFPDRLEVALVDVSGKGEEAGTRALHLSGAYGGLIGALPPERFLSAANDYLVRQNWDEGFATAVHVSIDLTTGDFEVRTGGHPPALYGPTTGGHWQRLGSGGPVLGLLEGTVYDRVCGRLSSGETVLLYTDGMVERRRSDIDAGTQRLETAADLALTEDPAQAAQVLVRRIGARDDDRAVVVIRRE